VPAKNVDSAALTSDRERGFDDGLPPGGPESRHHQVHDLGVGFVEQAVEPFSSPAEIELEVRPEGARNRMEACERDGANPTVFDQAHERVRHDRSRRNVALAKALPAAEGADRTAEAKGVHARTMGRRACL
jgi:hypothetical protein